MKNNNSSKIKEDKLKPLMPTLRLKKRFIKIKIESKKQYDFKELSSKLTDEIIYFIGVIDFSNAGIWMLNDKFNKNKQTLIIKVSTKFKDKLIAALSLITKLNSNDVRIKTLRVSGTLKGVEKVK